MAPDTGRPSPAGQAESGSIAILALWSVAIIALLLAGTIATTRADLRATQNAIDASRARLAAESGTRLGLARLLHDRADGVLVFDGTPEVWRDGPARVRIAIIDEAGKIDLNTAPAALIEGLLTAVGQSPEEALRLACSLLLWRGDRNTLCPAASETGPPSPRGPLLVAEELAQVPGFNEALYEEIADYVTVATRASAIDPLVAARTDLLAIPGATPGSVDAYLESRRDIGGAGADAFAGSPSFVTVSPGREFTITAIATSASPARYRSEMLVRLTDIPADPYRVLATRAPPVDRGRGVAPPLRRQP